MRSAHACIHPCNNFIRLLVFLSYSINIHQVHLYYVTSLIDFYEWIDTSTISSIIIRWIKCSFMSIRINRAQTNANESVILKLGMVDICTYFQRAQWNPWNPTGHQRLSHWSGLLNSSPQLRSKMLLFLITSTQYGIRSLISFMGDDWWLLLQSLQQNNEKGKTHQENLAMKTMSSLVLQMFIFPHLHWWLFKLSTKHRKSRSDEMI